MMLVPTRVILCRGALVLLAAAVLAGCSTANPFVRMRPDYSQVPQDALRNVARQIEEKVAAGDRDSEIAGQGGVVVSGPDVQQAIRTRAARSELLREFLATGHAMETNSGLVTILRTKEYKQATTRRERDRHALLVLSENENRWMIYEGILKASQFPPRSLSAIQAIFHEERVALLDPGHPYEDAGGNRHIK